MDNREHALRGWNWGKGDFAKAELSFTVQNRPAFEIPYAEIDNTQLAGKNEVSVEFKVPRTMDDTGANESLGGAFPKGKKLAGARDQLVEARFYIPGTTAVKKEKMENGDASGNESVDQDAIEDENAAQVWFDTLVEKAEISEVAGDTFATFHDVLHLTPRFVWSLPFKAVILLDTNAYCAGDALILTCMRLPFVCAAKRTTIKSSTIGSRSIFYFPKPMKYIS